MSEFGKERLWTEIEGPSFGCMKREAVEEPMGKAAEGPGANIMIEEASGMDEILKSTMFTTPEEVIGGGAALRGKGARGERSGETA